MLGLRLSTPWMVQRNIANSFRLRADRLATHLGAEGEFSATGPGFERPGSTYSAIIEGLLLAERRPSGCSRRSPDAEDGPFLAD
jgi:hypothetical protein